MNKFEALLKKQISHIYTTKDPLLFHEPANEVPVTSNYQRVSYMSSKGLFYIDTETKVKQNTKICIAVDVEDESLDQRICGAYGPGVSIATKNGYFRVFNANNQNELTDAPVLDNINIIESYENKIKVNGREITLQNSTSASNSNIILFGANYQNSLYQVSDCRIYYCDIYEGETLIKSFIPAYHKITHEVGMLDTVNNIFYKAKTLLPEGYQEVEYIESTGAQSINPDVTITADIGFEVTIDVATSSNGVIIGSYLPGTSNYMLYSYSNGNMTFFNGLNNPTTSLTVPRNTKGTIKVQNGVLSNTFDSSSQSLSGSLSGEVGYSLYLFSGRPSTSSNPFFSTCKMYRCKIFDGAATVRDFIPCYRVSDRSVGMYDIVGKTFYDSESESTFTAGNETLPDIGIDITNTSFVKKLPDAYQQLEYIESNGTQYIDTNINLSSSDIVKTKFEITSSTSSMADAIYGCHSNGIFFVLLMRNPTQARVGSSSNQATSTNYELNKIYDTSLTNGTYIENGITYTFTLSEDFTSLPSCYIMHRNQPNSVVTPVSAKVYSFEIVGKFNGIPCYKKDDGQEGLYDLVSKTFYPEVDNKNFTRGPILDEYIETITNTD